MVDFATETIGVDRLEPQSAVQDGRRSAAQGKAAAVQEAVLRRSFVSNGRYHDQALWSIPATEWRQAKAVWGPKVH